MKKISSVILAVLLAFSSIFCVNIAFADENASTLTKELKLTELGVKNTIPRLPMEQLGLNFILIIKANLSFK